MTRADVVSAAPAAAKLCTAEGGSEVGYTDSLAPAGHVDITIDHKKILFVDVPESAKIDMMAGVTATGAFHAKTTGSVTCALPLASRVWTFSTHPVPMALKYDPTATLDASANLSLTNVGLEAIAGVAVQGSMGLSSPPVFSAQPVLKAAPLEPKVTANGQIDVQLGGTMTLGPGAGTTGAGVLAGVKGGVYPINGHFGAGLPVGHPQYLSCFTIDGSASADVGLSAQAWFGGQAANYDVAIPGLEWKLQYPGTPWDFPKDCSVAPGTQPGTDVIGDGVEKVDEKVSGAPGQVGHVPGFVPGAQAWVLSTGRLNDAIGAPSFHASTDLGRPGSAALTALAGYSTRDAVTYTATVRPQHPTLKVRYAFATEEFPHFVGSHFNDVMAVMVDGKNCAAVPGTDDPVSVNTVNLGRNSEYFVDNRDGAAGYDTSMNGLTVPLTCSVPVTPGQPVTVTISVADASDGIYDSAVALVDGGIWSE